MKKILLISLFLIFVTVANGQMRDGLPRDGKALDRIEQMEKLKLIEILDLDEESTIKFFIRRNEFHKKQKNLMDEREKLLNDLEISFREKRSDDNFYKQSVSKLLDIEERIFSERQNFLISLNNLLSPQQIAKLTVFEFKFRKELTQSLLERGRGLKKN